MTWIRITAAAGLLGVSDDTVRRWVDSGTQAVRELGLEPGSVAVAVIKATNVIVETPVSAEGR